MKVMLWVTESNLELLNKGEIIQYWLREPGDQLNVVQVQLSYDQYIRLRDYQPEHYSTMDGEINTMFAPVQSMKGDTVTVSAKAYFADGHVSEEKQLQFIIK